MTSWRMSFRAGTNGPEMWDLFCRPLKVAAIQYGPVDDIDFSSYTSEDEFPSKVRDAWAKLKPNEKTSLRRFLFEMEADKDIIYVKKGPKIVGKGIVGPYRFDKKGRIKAPKVGSYWRHQRPVNWIEGFPEVHIQLGTQQIRTVKRLTDAEIVAVESLVQDRLIVPLPAQDADQDKAYVPDGTDRRAKVTRQICERRGQQDFRNALRKRYGDRCLVTGCKVLEVLEAAHIKPYQGEGDNHPENGLLLRADIHTLFDLDFLGIEPNGLKIQFHPSIACEYGDFDGKKLECTHLRPSKEALSLRYELFQRRLAKENH